ncbi:Serine/threonine-protein kinase pdik1l-A [Symbiodinium microadriaticum]|uniref:Serine/threonine-protein kinase pdik1l-A n=1 Tax=Symbiodinium microadriaticum TaxID=2951 RepID=A0A1Q9C8G1_SYMMI|nr:Serine/threonine-protein kinase pdik1l-A [Symbiodinium microadriaticum]CAE7824091.1 pdik1-b [Symbiodinium microadriaticum]CAE7914524.1 pdik1-b [Symbiodinium sp. KB8]
MEPTDEEMRRIQEQFAMLDLNGSGKIEREELQELLVFLGLDPRDGQLDTLWTVLDTDEDGLISFQEFLDFVFSTGDVSFFTPSELERVREYSQKRKASRAEQTPTPETSADNEEIARLQKRVEELEAEARKRDKVVVQLQTKLQAAREEQLMQKSRQNSKDTSAEREPAGPAPAASSDEIVRLKKQLHDKQYALQRLENQQEKIVEGYVGFLHSLMESSASEQLQNYCDLKTVEMLGRGAYGFVLTCLDKDHNQKVVVKLQSPRWAAVAAQEWSHGSKCAHDNIVAHLQVLLHYDGKSELERKLEKAFDDGIFTGKRPKILPDRYICMVLEYMDRGTAQHLSKEGLLDLEGLAAITRQISSALAFIHKSKQTHNDIKPENILLRKAAAGDHLVVKLADFGLAQWSVERQRDAELMAYSLWCLGLAEPFDHMPSKEERPAAAERFEGKALLKDSRQGLRSALGKVVRDLWAGCTEMAVVAASEDFCDMQLTIHHAKHAAVEAKARQEIPPRLERQAKLWKAVHMASIVRKWSHVDDSDDAH